ncbi:hypothetical protein ACQRWP_13560 [Micromonospora trifolii]|uniref:hypothetical protein n=1 Tax=Micromonospora trifolii TaxID=2911208 RepID=UPI003D2EB30D
MLKLLSEEGGLLVDSPDRRFVDAHESQQEPRLGVQHAGAEALITPVTNQCGAKRSHAFC